MVAKKKTEEPKTKKPDNQEDPIMVLPTEDVRTYLLGIIEKATTPGSMAEFVVGVKNALKTASITKAKPDK